MSLATRCTSCGTIFRVVQDQLKVSEGWVRCGRCQNVFNALQNLFDLDREQPPPWPPAPAPGTGPEPETPTWAPTQPLGADRPATPAAATPAPAVAPPTAAVRAAVPVPAPAPALATVGARAPQAPVRAAAPAAVAVAAPSTTALLHTASRETEGHPDTEGLTTQPEHRQPEHDEAESSGFLHARFNLDLVHDQSEAAAAIAAVHAPVGGSEPAPLFVRQAERAARWRQPRVRMALALLLVLLTAGLLGQIALQFRDALAAAWPEARGALQAMCEQLDCRIEPPRRLESLTVDASGLTRTATAGVYRLSVALHNHSHTIVMVPAVDLSLTDAQGHLFARRTLLPKELGATQASVAPGADLTLQAVLSTGAERVVGYTVEIFYP